MRPAPDMLVVTDRISLSTTTYLHPHVLGTLAIAAILRRKIATVDITGEYLECELPDVDEVLMALDPRLSRLLAELDPSVKRYTDESGKLVVKLKRALYGCVQSARLWYIKLRDTLLDLGYSINPYDLCTFHKDVNGEQIAIAFHVDDLLITAASEKMIDDVIKELEGKFVGVGTVRGDTHTYLGMNFAIKADSIELDMSSYLNKLVAEREGRAKTTPAKTDLMSDDESSELLCEKDQKLFHSEVAKILFVVKRIRMMCLPAISVLASKVGKATNQDRERLDRILDYLRSTKEMTLILQCGGNMD